MADKWRSFHSKTICTGVRSAMRDRHPMYRDNYLKDKRVLGSLSIYYLYREHLNRYIVQIHSIDWKS